MTPKPKSSQDVEPAGAGRIVCTRATLRQRGLLQVRSSEEEGPFAFSEERRDKARGSGHRPPSFVEVLKAEASRISTAPMQATSVDSATAQDAPVAMDVSGQQEEIKQRLNEVGMITHCWRSRVGRTGGGSESGEGDVVSTCPVDYATSVPTEKVQYSMNLESALGESCKITASSVMFFSPTDLAGIVCI